jgi:uncharacterized protein (DUF58 family)
VAAPLPSSTVSGTALSPWRGVRRLSRGFWERAPRQLKTTTVGKVVIGIAFAVGFAAINTGNNLLFLGWGLVLSAIVLSGLLSEATLKPLEVWARPPFEARARQKAFLPIIARNTARRLPAFGVETRALVEEATAASDDEPIRASGGFELKMEPGAAREARGQFTPVKRGLHRVRLLIAATAYPFGFFEKSRNFREERQTEFWVGPHVVDVAGLALDLFARLGEAPAAVAGGGDDFFALRPYRAGDDVRRVHWRRVARTGRWVVVENEANRGVAVILELALGKKREAADEVEHAIATLGSLAETLLRRGLRVGVRAPGALILPGSGDEQRRTIMYALARLNPWDSLPSMAAGQGVCRVVVALERGLIVEGADHVLEVPPMKPGERSA